MKKDNKLVIMCTLAAIWLVLFVGMAMGEFRLNRNVEVFVTFICVAWFAYWTISELWEGYNKTIPADEPTVIKTESKTNAPETSTTNK